MKYCTKNACENSFERNKDKSQVHITDKRMTYHFNGQSRHDPVNPDIFEIDSFPIFFLSLFNKFFRAESVASKLSFQIFNFLYYFYWYIYFYFKITILY